MSSSFMIEPAMTSRLKERQGELLPREKLLSLGREYLTHAELVALFLRTGVKGRNVLEVAADLIHAAGSISSLAGMSAIQIASLCKGIGMAKAATLAAVFELGMRAVQEQVKQEPMDKSQRVYEYLAPMTHWSAQECVYVLALDIRMNLISCKTISRGTLGESICHPRDVLHHVITHNAYGFILAHNHPSGWVIPSKDDDRVTHQIKAAADLLHVNLFDHIIMGKPLAGQILPYYSYRDNGGL